MPDKNFTKTILCIGAGYVGGPTMAMIAAKCPQYKVTVAEINAQKIMAWQTESYGQKFVLFYRHRGKYKKG